MLSSFHGLRGTPDSGVSVLLMYFFSREKMKPRTSPRRFIGSRHSPILNHFMALREKTSAIDFTTLYFLLSGSVVVL